MNKKTKTIIVLNILLMIFSMSGIFSKTAAGARFLSVKFIICYGILMIIMFVYAIGWQQIIKRLPLTTAYANRAVTVVWGIIWGLVFFQEKITIGKIIGAVVVIAGVMLYVTEKDVEAASAEGTTPAEGEICGTENISGKLADGVQLNASKEADHE